MTLTDIANLALGEIGETKTISSIDDSSHPAAFVDRNMADTIREVQGLIHWPELITTYQPEADPTDAEDGNYRYKIPDSIITIVKVEDYTLSYLNDAEWRIEGEHVLTDTENPLVTAVAYNEEPDDWNIDLRRCIVLALAARIAFGLTNSRTVAESAEKRYLFHRVEMQRRAQSRSSASDERVRYADRNRGYYVY